jgi:FAD synthase
MRIDLLHRLRGEERFQSAEELITQIDKDIEDTRKWFQSEKRKTQSENTK